MAEKFNFSGWATRNDLTCTDGRVIRRDAFKDDDRKVVPLIWQHDHSSPASVIGHALLENRKEGVYAYCSLNDSENGIAADKAVRHGDLKHLSIYANGLTQNGPNVVHGTIRELSLVMHGANPGAYIDNVIKHSDGSEAYGEEGFVYNDEIIDYETNLYLCHDVDGNPYISNTDDEEDYYMDYEELEHKDADDDRTVADVFDTLTDEQKIAVYFLIGAIQDKEAKGNTKTADSEETESDKKNKEDETTMKHNVFEDGAVYTAASGMDKTTLQHIDALRSETSAMFAEAFKKSSSLKEVVIKHADEYGIENIDWLFPDVKNLTNEPQIISQNQEWVADILGKVKHSPFSRIRTIFANITGDEARALGYVKGNRKIEEFIKLARRSVTPTTVYKKQKFDRDDVIDITSFDVVAFIRKEMRIKLNEEIARAILIGDGRDPVEDADNKIDEEKIIPIYTDDPKLFTVPVVVPVAQNDDYEAKAKNLIKGVIRARADYKGTGTPTFYCTPDVLADLLLVDDGIGRRLYRTLDELATALMVGKIVTVEAMKGVTREVTTGEGQAAVTATRTLAGIIVNMADYVVGMDKGGEINTFDDFDIDFNQMKYLMETRMSGMLAKDFSAMVVEFEPAQG